ncbi:MAG: hypothetical protein GY839_02825 [candidate division Zixibacteria bacterium]|nr:hypothetical protein [candidate division Zixibacteria bacterium]
MNASKFKKIIFVGLLVAFGGIWAYNLTLFIPKSKTEYMKASYDLKTPANKTIRASSFDFDWGYKLVDNLHDPFIPFYNKITKPVETEQPMIVPEIVIDQPFKYIGLIKGKNKTCGILTDRAGKTYVVVAGDTLTSTKILKVKEDILKLEYQGKEFELELNE